ncbi:transporter [uncultured Tenacibaculum sp.]|uniref:transporter n=1 Tax=uncultured Tenacibaculum sp. TaxID=174713 RepID=UPI002604D901|nr:transporter [uncultured Tenacibaculum sp.]
MKKITQAVCMLCIGFGMTTTLNAQGMFDGFMPKKGDLSITASFTKSDFDKFYLGDVKQDAVPVHGEINQNIVSLFAKYGITDRLSAVVNIPYISAENTSGAPDPVNGETSISGLQDITLGLKLNAYTFQFKKADLSILTAGSIVIPTNYEPVGILSLGNGGFGVDLRLGLHLQTDIGFFSTLYAGYNLRGDADNNLMPNRGDFNVPNSFVTTGKIGYASKFIYVEAWADYNNSETGVDIGSPAFTGNFPETDVDYARVGLTVYKEIIPNLGLSAGIGKVIDGRNLGDSIIYSGGITYNLSLLN